MNLFRSPNESNIKTGNVTMTHSEFSSLKNGGYNHIMANGMTVPVSGFMVSCAKDMGSYMLVPIVQTSFLVRRK